MLSYKVFFNGIILNTNDVWLLKMSSQTPKAEEKNLKQSEQTLTHTHTHTPNTAT